MKFQGRRFLMESVSKWMLTDAEKDGFIASLTANLSALRTQAEISQEELANLVGVSRQTYSAIERKIRRMSWSTYLSLVLFFDHNQKTHRMLRALSIFPRQLIVKFNDGTDYSSFELSSLLGDQTQEIVDRLDEQALQSIRSVFMMEYARCTQLPSDVIIKSFGGMNYSQSKVDSSDIDAMLALKALKKSSDKNGE